ncbi:MAG TPA: ATP-binding protein [Nocardioidaceae bacterium]|nr:ATP-binding protein [Nocardioidaceae bacterium]
MATTVTPPDRAPVRMLVPFSASSVPVARRQLKDWMADHGSSAEHIEDARLIVSELVANAIRHAQPLPDGNLVVSWSAQGRELDVSVTDGGGPTRPRKVKAHTSALSGRGMAIIDTVAVSWWAERTRSKSTVHARLLMG